MFCPDFWWDRSHFCGMYREGEWWTGKRRNSKGLEGYEKVKEEKKNRMKSSRRRSRSWGALWQGPTPQDPRMTRVSGYVLMGHPPMRIMGRFFIWEILNMPGVGGHGEGEERGGAEKRQERRVH